MAFGGSYWGYTGGISPSLLSRNLGFYTFFGKIRPKNILSCRGIIVVDEQGNMVGNGFFQWIGKVAKSIVVKDVKGKKTTINY